MRTIRIQSFPGTPIGYHSADDAIAASINENATTEDANVDDLVGQDIASVSWSDEQAVFYFSSGDLLSINAMHDGIVCRRLQRESLDIQSHSASDTPIEIIGQRHQWVWKRGEILTFLTGSGFQRIYRSSGFLFLYTSSQPALMFSMSLIMPKGTLLLHWDFV